MHHSKRFGCHVYPLLFLIFLAVPGLIAQNPTQRFPGPGTGSDPAGESATKSGSPGPGGSSPDTGTPRSSESNGLSRIPTATSSKSMAAGATRVFVPAARCSTSTNPPGMPDSPIIFGAALGITADLRGYYGTAFIPPNPYNIFKPSISEYTFMAGPQYRFVRREHWAISGQVLVGGSKGNFNANGAGVLPAPWSDFGVTVPASVLRRLCPSITTSVRRWRSVFNRATG